MPPNADDSPLLSNRWAYGWVRPQNSGLVAAPLATQLWRLYMEIDVNVGWYHSHDWNDIGDKYGQNKG